MEKMMKFPLLFFILICFDNNPCYPQVLTSNDGFEGAQMQGIPPTYWSNCNDGHSSVDTQPGFFHNYTPASQGQTYISMVARELNPPGTVETVWTNLLTPFEVNKTYSFNIDLSLSHDFYGSINGVDYHFDNPCVLQIIGFNGDCDAPQDSELLWQSNVLNNYYWHTFNVLVTPTKATFQNIAIRPFFSPSTNYKNSVVFVDNLRYDIAPNIVFPNIFTPNGDIINDTFYMQGENITQVDIKVYNRWGNLVIETQDKNEAWTGRSKNQDCSEGVYYYVANITFVDGKTIVKKGYVTLLK